MLLQIKSMLLYLNVNFLERKNMKKFIYLLLTGSLLVACNSGSTNPVNSQAPYAYTSTNISSIDCLSAASVSTVTMSASNVNPSAYIDVIYNNLPQSVQISYSGACNGKYSSASPSCVAILSTNTIQSESNIIISFRLNGVNGPSNQLGTAIVPICN